MTEHLAQGFMIIGDFMKFILIPVAAQAKGAQEEYLP